MSEPYAAWDAARLHREAAKAKRRAASEFRKDAANYITKAELAEREAAQEEWAADVLEAAKASFQ